MNRAQFCLLLYLLTVVGITFVHQAGWLLVWGWRCWRPGRRAGVC